MKKILALTAAAGLLLSAPLLRADVLKVPGEAVRGEGELFYYTIVKRDTLWDISKKFLKNPFKWPDLWKMNTYIKNPDLIYPGNLVKFTPDGGIEVIGKKEAEIETLPVVALEDEKTVVLEPEGEEAATVKEEQVKPVPAIEDSSIERRGFISGKELESSGTIIGESENKLLMTWGDEVFVKLKSDGDVKPGDDYLVFTVGKEIKHPVTEKTLGNMVDVLGTLEVVSVGEVTTARITVSYKEILAGARLSAYREPVRQVEIKSPEAEVNGMIVASLEGKDNLSKGDIAYLDKGISSGLRTGNMMKVYRERGDVKDPDNKKNRLALPADELGTLIVIETSDSTSTALVVDTLKPIVMGDLVRTAPAEAK